MEKTDENFVIGENFVIDEYLVILSEAKDLCTLLAAPKMHRSFAAKNAAQDDKPCVHTAERATQAAKSQKLAASS